MKVIIMEVNGKEAVALGHDGGFVRIRNLGYAVGQEIQITPEMLIRQTNQGHTRRFAKIAALAACFCLLFGSIISFLILNSPSYGYVSVDVNPSIEFRINGSYCVVSASAANPDGQTLLESIGINELEGKDIEIALALTIDELSVQGYLDVENAGLIISSSAGSKKASAALNEKLVAYTAGEEKLAGVEIVTAIVSQDMIEEANDLGTTAGKLHLIQSLGEDVDVQDWIDKSVTEIYAAVKEHNSELPADPETEIEPPPEVTVEPETSVGTDEETATSEPVPDTTDEPDVTTEAPTETDTETETESETEKETETETETETEAEVPPETETPEEEKTWPETWPETMPDEWPEEWPDPETDDSGNTVIPEPENKPWWWYLLAWIFGWS